MEYQTVFEMGRFANKAADFGFITLFWLILGWGGLISGWISHWKRISFKRALFFFIFTSAICGTFVGSYDNDYRRLRRLEQTVGAQTIEGIVADFKAYPATLNASTDKLNSGNDKKEHFCVKDICFEYHCCEMDVGFNEMQSQGSPIRDGLPVRITYVDGTIIKLEVGQEH